MELAESGINGAAFLIATAILHTGDNRADWKTNRSALGTPLPDSASSIRAICYTARQNQSKNHLVVMNKVSVRCWIVENYPIGKTTPDLLFITYPEDNSGHDLITCLNCGEIYAVTVAKEVYIGPPLPQKLKDINCIKCVKLLTDNYAYYPETYISDRKQHAFKRAIELPDDSLSIVKDFYGIYE